MIIKLRGNLERIALKVARDGARGRAGETQVSFPAPVQCRVTLAILFQSGRPSLPALWTWEE